jgi:hypothetical protein
VRPLPFDRVTVDDAAGTVHFSADEFLAVALHRRVAWILESRLAFSLWGKPVDSRVALMALRERWKPG